jgi:uncharacterized protein YciI
MADDIQARVGAMLNHEVVAIVSKPRPGFDPQALLGRHLDFIVALEQEGLVLLSGPTAAPELPAGSGLTVLNVGTIEAARRIWADEPFHHAGARDAEFFVWRLMEGNLGVSFSLSDGRFRLRAPTR